MKSQPIVDTIRGTRTRLFPRREMTEGDLGPFAPVDFMRQDESDDRLFYQLPRLVVHIDDKAIAAIGELFKEIIPPNSVILDLMSSWRSHWPQGYSKARMVGLGLNAVEMRENPNLDDYVIHNVNVDPRLPFDDSTFDAVIITVSIQYLIRPIEVFQDVSRILKPGGLFLVIFSNRMFFTKAVRIWTVSDDEGRMNLVASYFQYAGDYEDIKGVYRNPQRASFEDPVYVVMARKASI